LIQVLSSPPIKASGADSVVIVDNRNDSRDFLASRRARITPQQAGLPAYGGNRRVPGLRREDVALLGDLHLTFEAMDLAADPGLSLVVYTAVPGSTSQDGLNLLASWAATLDQTEAAQDAPETEHRGLETQGR
jgi:hypothetical protein